MIEMPIGWLSPTGEIIECYTYEHTAIASNIVDKYGLASIGLSSDEVLIKNQWIHITRGQFFDHDYHVYYNLSKGPTAEQIRF